jgi:hypothetical protein
MIAALGKLYGKLAERVGHTAAGALALGVAGLLWLALAWWLGELG